MIPLNFKHSNRFSSRAPFFSVQYLHRLLGTGKVWLNFEDLLIDDFSRNFNAPLELRYMEDIMNSC